MSKAKEWIGRQWRDERGASALELAICMPILLLFAVALLDLGNMILTNTAANSGATAAARTLVVTPDADDAALRAAAESDAPTLKAMDYTVTVSWGDNKQTDYVHHFAQADGTTKDIAATRTTQAATVTITAKRPWQTVFGKAWGAACGMGDMLVATCSSTSDVDRTDGSNWTTEQIKSFTWGIEDSSGQEIMQSGHNLVFSTLSTKNFYLFCKSTTNTGKTVEHHGSDGDDALGAIRKQLSDFSVTAQSFDDEKVEVGVDETTGAVGITDKAADAQGQVTVQAGSETYTINVYTGEILTLTKAFLCPTYVGKTASGNGYRSIFTQTNRQAFIETRNVEQGTETMSVDWPGTFTADTAKYVWLDIVQQYRTSYGRYIYLNLRTGKMDIVSASGSVSVNASKATYSIPEIGATYTCSGLKNTRFRQTTGLATPSSALDRKGGEYIVLRYNPETSTTKRVTLSYRLLNPTGTHEYKISNL